MQAILVMEAMQGPLRKNTSIMTIITTTERKDWKQRRSHIFVYSEAKWLLGGASSGTSRVEHEIIIFIQTESMWNTPSNFHDKHAGERTYPLLAASKPSGLRLQRYIFPLDKGLAEF
jgi:hypothetical protein